MKKILVTGGTGFIGTNLIAKLISKEISITSLDDYSTGSRDNELSAVTYVKGDIESIDQFLDRDHLNHKVLFSGGHMQEQSSDLLRKFFQSKRKKKIS